MFSFELDFLKQLEGLRTDFLNGLFQGITLLGEETLMILLVVTLWFAVDKRAAQKLLFVTAGSLCVNGILKNLVKLPRPSTQGITCVRAETATGYSFPSGHTQGFATWSTLLAANLRKRWLWCLAAVLTVLVGFSRLYLGAHYPSDVVTGILLGAGLALLGNLLFDKIQDPAKLYLGSLILFFPFFVCFFQKPDPLFADAFKVYGMIGGLALVAFLDRKCPALSYDVSLWKKILRILIGVFAAFLLKEGIKAMNVFHAIQWALLFDALRYFIVVFAVGFLCPQLFRKIRL